MLSPEDLQVSEDKMDHLSKIKTKLEVTLDELNLALLDNLKVASFRFSDV